MAAGDCRYLWADKKVTKPIECTAPEYVDNLMSWVESQLNDETIFPIKFDSSYPKKFHAICSTIYKRFFRVYAHIYHRSEQMSTEHSALFALEQCHAAL